MRRLVAIAVLLLAWLGLAEVQVHGGSPSAGLATAGAALMLLAAITLGEALAPLGLPRLVGWLLAGLVAGPATSLLHADVAWHLAPLEALALSLVMLDVGLRIDLGALRGHLRTALVAALAAGLGPAALVFAATLLVAPLLPGLPELSGSWVALACLTAALSFASSPTVLGTIISEGDSRGPVSQLALGVSSLGALLLPLALAGGLAGGAGALGVGQSHVGDALGALGLSIGLGVAAGFVFGLAASAMGRLAGLGVLVLAATLTVALRDLGAEPLIAMLVAGCVANAGPSIAAAPLREGLAHLSLPAAVVAFALVGASAPAPSRWGLALGAIVLVVARGVGLGLVVLASRRWISRSVQVRRSLWMLWVPRGGVTLGALAIATHALAALAPTLVPLVAGAVALEILLGSTLAKAALHRAGELAIDREAAGPEGTAPSAPLPAPAGPDPALSLLTERKPPLDGPTREAWAGLAMSLDLFQDRLADEVVSIRLARVARALRTTSGQARHAVQAAAEAVGRATTPDEVLEALRHHRRYLAEHVREELEHLPAPALTDGAPPVLHIIAAECEALVREAPASLLVREAERHLRPSPSEGATVRIRKALKRLLRRAEALVGREVPIREVPFRRIVRRHVAGTLLVRLAPLADLVGQAECRAIRRMETVLRRSDEALADAAQAAEEQGEDTETIRAALLEELGELRTATDQALEDIDHLRALPGRFFAEEAARALDAVRYAADVADTFQLDESDLRFASVAPAAREAIEAAAWLQERWGERQRALLDRIGLWMRLVELKQRLRARAIGAALGPVQRMHDRVMQLVAGARDRVLATRGTLSGLEPGPGPSERSAQEVSKLLRELERRVDRPLEGIVHALRSGAVVDRLLGALETASEPLPEAVLLLGESAILQIERGQATSATPHPVEVRALTRSFFDRSIAVRLAEHVRALESSAADALAAVHDGMRLLSIQAGSAEGEGDGVPPISLTTASRVPNAGAEGSRAWTETLEAVAERLEHETRRGAEEARAMLAEVEATKREAIGALWTQLMATAARDDLDRALGGARRWLGESWRALAADPRLASLRELYRSATRRLEATRRAVEARADRAISGPAELRRALAALDPREAELPYVYGKLFSLEPTENEAFVVGRDRELDHLRERVRAGGGGAMVIVGERGSGRTSLVRVALSRDRAERPTIWLQADRPFGDATVVRKWVARSLGFTGPVTDPAIVAAEVRQRSPLIVVDGLERMLERSGRGLDALAAFADLVGSTTSEALWICTCERRTWDLLGRTTALSDLFDTLIRLGPLGPGEVREAVESRHSLSGLRLHFAGTRDAAPRPLSWLDTGGLERKHFARVTSESAGVPRTALQLWALSCTPGEERTMVARPCPSPHLPEGRVISSHLAPALEVALLQGYVDEAHLCRAAGWTEVEARAAVAALGASGMLERRERTDGRQNWVLPTWAEATARRRLADLGLGEERP